MFLRSAAPLTRSTHIVGTVTYSCTPSLLLLAVFWCWACCRGCCCCCLGGLRASLGLVTAMADLLIQGRSTETQLACDGDLQWWRVFFLLLCSLLAESEPLQAGWKASGRIRFSLIVSMAWVRNVSHPHLPMPMALMAVNNLSNTCLCWGSLSTAQLIPTKSIKERIKNTYQGAMGWMMGCTAATEGAPKEAESRGKWLLQCHVVYKSMHWSRINKMLISTQSWYDSFPPWGQKSVVLSDEPGGWKGGCCGNVFQ